MAMNGAGDDLDDLDDLDSNFDFEDLILPEEEREEHQRTKEALEQTQKKLEATQAELENVKQTFEEEKKVWNADLGDLSDLEDFELDADLKALSEEQDAHIQTKSELTRAVAEVKALNTFYKIAEEKLLRANEEIESLKSNLNSEIEKAKSLEATLQIRNQELIRANQTLEISMKEQVLTDESVKTLQSDLAAVTQKAQSAEAILQTRDITFATLKQTVERLESDLAAETEKAKSIEISLQGREKELREANQGIEMFRSNLKAETKKKEDAEATLQSRDKELATANQVLEARAKELFAANQKIELLEAQLQAAKNSGFVYSVKRVVNFINRPSVMTGLTVGGIFALATPLTPLAIAGYSAASLIGIEGFKKIRDKFGERHLQAAKKADQVDSNHPYFVHGQRAEQEWKAYLNPFWIATFVPSFMNDKSKAFQMGREAKRMEIRNEVAVKKQSHKLS